MAVERIVCEGNTCKTYGDGFGSYTVDYVFAYTPVFVRYEPPSRVVMDFDPPVDCERRDDYDLGVSYLYCAPVLRSTRLEVHEGEIYLQEGE